MEILIYLLGFIGGWLCYRQMIISFLKKVDHNGRDNVSHEPNPHMECVAEKYQDQYLLYQHPDGKFLAQGTNLEFLVNQISQQYQRPVTVKISEFI